MTDADLFDALLAAEQIEVKVRHHLRISSRPFEQDRGQTVYRSVKGLRCALEEWITTRAQGPRPVTKEGS